MTRSKKTTLANRLRNLQIQLAPLVPLPSGPPHPAFPATLLAYHLLTEDELDSIAHYYHQSTPGLWTYQYPACMNWDKTFLDASKIRRASADVVPAGVPGNGQSGTELKGAGGAEAWLDLLVEASCASTSTLGGPVSPRSRALSSVRSGTGRHAPPTTTTSITNQSQPQPPPARRWSTSQLSDVARVAMKRRKVGKFIGLLGMDTPIEEIENRIQHSLERAMELAREERRMREERELRGRKV